MKALVFTCVPLLIIALLKKHDLLPGQVANVLSFIIFFIGLIVFLRRVHNLASRSNMNYDEFKFEVIPGLVDDRPGGGESVWDYDKNQLDNLWDDTKQSASDAETYASDEFDQAKSYATKQYDTVKQTATQEWDGISGQGGPAQTAPQTSTGPNSPAVKPTSTPSGFGGMPTFT